jgi:hypothetical protein
VWAFSAPISYFHICHAFHRLKDIFYTFNLFGILMVQAAVSFKSGGVGFILTFSFGLFFFDGVDHMFIGKVRMCLPFPV